MKVLGADYAIIDSIINVEVSSFYPQGCNLESLPSCRSDVLTIQLISWLL